MRQRDAVRARVERANALLYTAQSLVTAFAGPLTLAALAPAIVVRLGGSDLAIGMLGTVANAIGIPAMLVAAHLSGRARRRTLATLLWNLANPLLFLPLVLLLATGQAPTLPVFMGGLLAVTAVSGLAGAVGGVLQVDLLSRITAPGRRGRITGIAGSAGGLAGLLGGGVLSLLLASCVFPSSYALACGLGLLFAAAGCLAYPLYRPLPGTETFTARALPGLRQSLQVIARDRVFIQVLLAAMAKYCFSAGYAFVVPTALRRPGFTDAFVGHAAVVASAVAIAFGPVQGWFADRWGISRAAGVGGLVGALAILLFTRVHGYGTTLATIGLLTVGSSMLAGMFFLVPLALSPPEHRSAYIACRYMAESIAGVVCMPVVGYALGRWDTTWVFGGAAFMAVLAAAVLVRATGWYCRRPEAVGPG